MEYSLGKRKRFRLETSAIPGTSKPNYSPLTTFTITVTEGMMNVTKDKCQTFHLLGIFNNQQGEPLHKPTPHIVKVSVLRHEGDTLLLCNFATMLDYFCVSENFR